MPPQELIQWRELLEARTGYMAPHCAALYLGDMDWCCDVEWLQSENVTVVVNNVERYSGWNHTTLPRRRELLREALPGLLWMDWSPASEHQQPKVEDFVLRLTERLLEGRRVALMDSGEPTLNAAAAACWALYALGSPTCQHAHA